MGRPVFMIYVAPDGPGEYKAGAEAGAACQAHLTPPSLGPVAKASVECCGGEVLGVPYEIRGDATGRIHARNWDEAKEEYADYLIAKITADYMPDLKARLLKRAAHSLLGT